MKFNVEARLTCHFGTFVSLMHVLCTYVTYCKLSVYVLIVQYNR